MRCSDGEVETGGAAHGVAGALPHALSDLIGAVYDCTLDPARWEPTLGRIAEEMAAESAILSLNDLRRNRLVIDKSVGWGRFGIEERQKHIPEIHGRLSEWFAKGPSLDEPFIASRELPPDYLADSLYVQRCLKPLGIVDVMHLFVMYTPLYFSEFVVARHARHGPVTDREVGIGALLLPHLRRAVTISNVLDSRAIERARMAEALDALECGVVLTNDRGAILHANRSAESMLRSGAALRSIGGVLAARAPSAAQELRQAIRLAARDEAMLGKAGLSVRLTAPEAAPLFAHVLPMNGSDLRVGLQTEAVAAVIVGAPAAQASPTREEAKAYLHRRFGLTNAEVAVALEIFRGDGREAAATRLGISMTTVRAHLSHIFEKTGVRRQAELVRLLTECGRAGTT